MAITDTDFLHYEEKRRKRLSPKVKNTISSLFDKGGDFNEDNWNGGDPLRDFAERLYAGYNDKRVLDKSISMKAVFDQDLKVVRDIKINHFNFKGSLSLEVFTDEGYFYAIYNDGSESLILKWRDNSGRTTNISFVENRDIQDNFYDSIITEDSLSYSFLSIDDYIDVMNKFGLDINEFE